jgi:hypothetical protein
MHTAFIEVLKDLWYFVISKQCATGSSNEVVLHPKKSPKTVLPLETPPPLEVSYSLESRICYIAQSHVRCLQTAQKKFDTLRGLLRYGDVVKVIQHKEKWSFVESTAVQGWVKSTCLTDDKNSVYPQLLHDHVYDEHHLETKKLRKYLNDELLGGLLGIKLQTSEWVIYQLTRLGTEVAWPLERPRLPGMWQSILSGKRGVSIGTEPKTGSVLEYNGDTESFIAFVESVTPDDSIVVSCVGRQKLGVYENKEFTRAQWREWRPVFISFT